jgi:hypothetical protein
MFFGSNFEAWMECCVARLPARRRKRCSGGQQLRDDGDCGLLTSVSVVGGLFF